MKKVAVIPARGGSTRLKGKNIRLLGGKPLIRWMVEKVVLSEQFDKVIVSTDSDEIFEAVKDLPVSRHIRPSQHATVKATVLNAMIDLMGNLEEKYDIFAYFLPTCPFLPQDSIMEGIRLLENEGVQSVVSVSQYDEPIQLACIKKGDWLVPVFDNLTSGLTNSKFIQKYHKPNGGFYMAKWDHLLEHKNFFKGDVKCVDIPQKYLVDIDTKEDLDKAEYMVKNMIISK